MKKRFLIMLLLFSMILSSVCVPVYAAESVFTDVDSKDWFFDQVNYAFEKGLMNGVGNERFDPAGGTTRGMLVTILHRLSGDTGSYSYTFRDVKPGSYCEKAIAWAAAKGVVFGYSALQFGPNDLLTREQIATILFRYAKLSSYETGDKRDLGSYSDWEEISGFAFEAMQWANSAGLITGRTEDTLAPKGTASRAEMATILSRFCKGFVENAPEVDTEEKPLPDDTGKDPQPDNGGKDPQPEGGDKPVSGHHVTFKLSASDSQPYTTIQVPAGGTVSAPLAPERFGQTFLGWFTMPQGGEMVVFPATVEKDMVFYARWQGNSQAEAANVFVLIGDYDPEKKTVVVELWLRGDVELCGFDMRLNYDPEILKLKELNDTCDLSLVTSVSEKDGQILFNYASAINTTRERQVLIAEFSVMGRESQMMDFRLQPVEVIRTDAAYEIHPADHSCVGWNMGI